MIAAAEVLKAWEACDKTDSAFILVCSVFSWPIIPAVGLGYSGYSTRRSGLASFMPALLAVAVCTIQWWLFGYSLAYGEGNGFIGDLKHFMHHNVLAEPVGTIPAILFSEFQLIFCATVCAIAIGGACERGRLLPLIPFIFVSISCKHGLAEKRLTVNTALGYIRLLSASAYGMGRWFPRRPRCS